MIKCNEVPLTIRLTQIIRILPAYICILFLLFPGDPVLPGVEWQPENSSLYLHPGATEPSHLRDELQTVCAAGGRGRTDLSAQQHIRGGEFVEALHAHRKTDALFIGCGHNKTAEDNFNSRWPGTY